MLSQTEVLARALELAAGLGEYGPDKESRAAAFLTRVLPTEFVDGDPVTERGWTLALKFAADAHHAFEATVARGPDPHWAEFYAAVALQYLAE